LLSFPGGTTRPASTADRTSVGASGEDRLVSVATPGGSVYRRPNVVTRSRPLFCARPPHGCAKSAGGRWRAAPGILVQRSPVKRRCGVSSGAATDRRVNARGVPMRRTWLQFASLSRPFLYRCLRVAQIQVNASLVSTRSRFGGRAAFSCIVRAQTLLKKREFHSMCKGSWAGSDGAGAGTIPRDLQQSLKILLTFQAAGIRPTGGTPICADRDGPIW
jgi:hypothetical protein